MVQLDKKPFVEQAIDTRCHAFGDYMWFGQRGDSSFGEGELGQEFYPELSCTEEPPQLEYSNDNENIQGTMCFLGQNGTLADLYLVCNYYNEIGEYYYVFWDCREADYENGISQWMVWLPNVKYPN